MAVLTAVDMGTRTFVLQVPAHANANSDSECNVSTAVSLASANVLVKVGGLDPPPLGQSPKGQISSSSPTAASYIPPLRASPYETGLCIDKGSAGSSAGWCPAASCLWFFCLLTFYFAAKEQPRQLQRARLK